MFSETEGDLVLGFVTGRGDGDGDGDWIQVERMGYESLTLPTGSQHCYPQPPELMVNLTITPTMCPQVRFDDGKTQRVDCSGGGRSGLVVWRAPPSGSGVIPRVPQRQQGSASEAGGGAGRPGRNQVRGPSPVSGPEIRLGQDLGC